MAALSNEEILIKSRLLPDGKTTTDDQVWLQTWAAFAQKQVQLGKIKLWDVPEFDPDTGHVPNSFIEQLYLKHRKLH